MRTMFILMSHQMTQAQYDDAKESYGASEFVELPRDTWSQIPAEADDISAYLAELKDNILKQSELNDILLVQGDFGATVSMVNFAFQNGLLPVYATTRRAVKEIVDGDKIITTRTFEHVRFRIYEKGC